MTFESKCRKYEHKLKKLNHNTIDPQFTCSTMKKYKVKKNDVVKILDSRQILFHQRYIPQATKISINDQIFNQEGYIAEGGNGAVHKFRNPITNEYVAVKTGYLNSDIDMIKILNSQNICVSGYVNSVFDSTENVIVMDIVDGTIESLAQKYKYNLTLQLLTEIMLLTTIEMSCLIKHGYYYADIKGGNIFYQCDPEGKISIILGDIGSIFEKYSKEGFIATYPPPHRNLMELQEITEGDIVFMLGVMILALSGYNIKDFYWETVNKIPINQNHINNAIRFIHNKYHDQNFTNIFTSMMSMNDKDRILLCDLEGYLEASSTYFDRSKLWKEHEQAMIKDINNYTTKITSQSHIRNGIDTLIDERHILPFADTYRKSEHTNKDAERIGKFEAVRKEVIRKDAERAKRIEAERRDAIRRETIRRDYERKEAIRKRDLERKEAVRREKDLRLQKIDRLDNPAIIYNRPYNNTLNKNKLSDVFVTQEQNAETQKYNDTGDRLRRHGNKNDPKKPITTPEWSDL